MSVLPVQFRNTIQSLEGTLDGWTDRVFHLATKNVVNAVMSEWGPRTTRLGVTPLTYARAASMRLDNQPMPLASGDEIFTGAEENPFHSVCAISASG